MNEGIGTILIIAVAIFFGELLSKKIASMVLLVPAAAPAPVTSLPPPIRNSGDPVRDYLDNYTGG